MGCRAPRRSLSPAGCPSALRLRHGGWIAPPSRPTASGRTRGHGHRQSGGHPMPGQRSRRLRGRARGAPSLVRRRRGRAMRVRMARSQESVGLGKERPKPAELRPAQEAQREERVGDADEGQSDVASEAASLAELSDIAPASERSDVHFPALPAIYSALTSVAVRARL